MVKIALHEGFNSFANSKTKYDHPWWWAFPKNRMALLFVTIILFSLGVSSVLGQAGIEAFDGSFQLETGEVITGGYSGDGTFIYMDTEGLDKGGVFQRVDTNLLGALEGFGGIGIEFITDENDEFNSIIWREPGQEPIHGERIRPHNSKAIQFSSGDGTQLQGRLLIPECPGPHPVIVYLHGSGPVSRYGGPFHTFFLKHGIALLAYNKRGYTSDPDEWQEPDYEQMSADAVAAVRFAADQPELDSDRIGIFGTSQGGWTAPPAAVEAQETDFLIVRVGPSITAYETVLHEVKQELRAEGMSGLDLDYAIDLREEIYRLAMEGEPISATDELVSPYLNKPWYIEAYGGELISEQWSGQWWDWAHKNLSFTPSPALERFEGSVLWFLAENDEAVPLIHTRRALEKAFNEAPSRDQEIVVLEDVPHSFLKETPTGPQYVDGFFNYMNSWMRDRGFTNDGCFETDQ